jgi:hypothetical protein
MILSSLAISQNLVSVLDFSRCSSYPHLYIKKARGEFYGARPFFLVVRSVGEATTPIERMFSPTRTLTLNWQDQFFSHGTAPPLPLIVLDAAGALCRGHDNVDCVAALGAL